jgi:hypothetical protein
MSVAQFCTQLSQDVVHIKSLFIFLVKLILIKKTKCCSMCTDKENDNIYIYKSTQSKIFSN